MSAFSVLTGKALTSAIKGYGKAVATFSAKTHQLAFSALNHVEVHNCPSHLNNLYAATPLNYRGALRVWAVALGKVNFTAEPEVAGQFFGYVKAKASDMAKARDVSPAEFQKDSKSAAEKPFDELKALETFLAKMDEKGASVMTLRAIEGAIATLKPKAAPVAAETPAKGPKITGKLKSIKGGKPAEVQAPAAEAPAATGEVAAAA